MKIVIERNLATGVTTIRLTGALTRVRAPAIHSAVDEAAAECPTGVIVDLSALGRASESALGLFPDVAHRAQLRWGVPVLLCGARPEVHRAFGAFRDFVDVYDHHWQALAVVRAYVPRWVWRRFAPEPDSAAAARALIGEVCEAWDLPRIREPARLVVSELATNAIRHAATAFDVTVARTGRYLRIAVQDGSSRLPLVADAPALDELAAIPEHGWGLRTVEAASSHWGTTRIPYGKIVWSLLGVGEPR